MTEKDRLYRNDRLFHLLEQPDHADLVFLLKNGLGKAEKKYGQYTRDQLKDIISSELRRAAGNNFANFFSLQKVFN